ncbi:hypothetical protein NEMBOFW57_006235 [Staphylotrichum longicolle]|uniref:Uncharacterized protein n=1 Tax=Staphylotrichum longicolle TaxID=669026 RepID=A0AAD4EY56_9PEZI|nr:hypothetical protein NEMBOFW57_006235 [Staphylotrichum longicolle]
MAVNVISSPLEDDGYTSSDSSSGERLGPGDWQLHQIRTRSYATKSTLRQYWHAGPQGKLKAHENGDRSKDKDEREHDIEHQIFMDSGQWRRYTNYDFDLRLGDIQQVMVAKENTLVVLIHKEGNDGPDQEQRGHIMAQFKRRRTKKRFLHFLQKQGLTIMQSDP